MKGLRRSGIRYPDGTPPVPGGCRWCGAPYLGHAQGIWVAARGWHQWEEPTTAQVRARSVRRRLWSGRTSQDNRKDNR